jgi:hypothetical protein
MQLDGDPSADSRIDLRKDSEQPIATEVPSKENVRFVSLRGGKSGCGAEIACGRLARRKGASFGKLRPSVLSVMLAPSATADKRTIYIVVSGSHWTMLALRQTACCADSDTLEAQSDQFNEIKKSAYLWATIRLAVPYLGARSPNQYAAVTPPSIRKWLPVMNAPSEPIRSAPTAPTSSGVPARPAADASIMRR